MEEVCFKKFEAEGNLVSRQLDEQQGRAACLPGSKDEKVAGYSQWGGEDSGLLQSQAEQAPGIRLIELSQHFFGLHTKNYSEHYNVFVIFSNLKKIQFFFPYVWC